MSFQCNLLFHEQIVVKGKVSQIGCEIIKSYFKNLANF